MIFDGKGKDMTPDTTAWIYKTIENRKTGSEALRACA
jgi:hypothetical protein